MIYSTRPDDFNPVFEIVSCYLEHEGTFLMLHRNADKSQGGKWGTVAGKIDAGESPEEAMMRETREETGIALDPVRLEHLGVQYVRYPTADFPYHIFRYTLDERPEVRLSPAEHSDYRWVTPEEALGLTLVDDMEEVIRLTHPQ